MAAVNRPRARVAVKACHASAKTFTAAEIVLWWVAAVRGIAITTAPTWPQVEKLLWGEIHKAHGSARLPLGGQLNAVEWRLAPDVYAMGLSTDQGVRFQGFHGTVLVVLDEAPGVRPDIFEAIEGIRAGGDVRLLMLGNPTTASGPFYDAFGRDRGSWRTFTIDAMDTPNLAGTSLAELRAIPYPDGTDDPALDVAPRPYLVTRRWIWEKLHEWGEASPLWQSRVRGRFPEQSEDALISLAWLEAAALPAEADPSRTWVAGVDVAGPGEDETVLCLRRGPEIAAIAAWSVPDPMGSLVAAMAPYRGEGLTVNIDSIGIGYHLAHRLRDAGYDVREVNVGERAADPEKYANLKAELYWGLRQRFEAGSIRGLADDLAVSQLAGVRYGHNARGQVVIESKESARKRGVKSPDRAEAVMLAFARPARPMVW